MQKYFLMKRGLYYRPNSAGYTSEIVEAGVYGEDEVKGYKAEPAMGVSVIPIGQEHIDELQRKIEQAKGIIRTSAAGIDGLKAVLAEGGGGDRP